MAGAASLGSPAGLSPDLRTAPRFLVPELPEAETIARGLRPHLPGRRIDAVRWIHEDVLDRPGSEFAAALTGTRFEAVGRRGKNLVLRLEDDRRLVVNLGMSGRLLHRPLESSAPPPTHPAVRFQLGDAAGELVYHDVRRFGTLAIRDPEEWKDWTDRLGPEPLGPDFTVEWLQERLGESRMPLRSWLLDQRKVAGVGNIYASEIAFVAGIHPQVPVREIPGPMIPRLHHATRQVLKEAVDARGTTLRDYRTAQGWEGEYGHQLRAYGRAGDPCRRCGTRIVRIVFSNRSAFLCPECQQTP